MMLEFILTDPAAALIAGSVLFYTMYVVWLVRAILKPRPGEELIDQQINEAAEEPPHQQ